MRPAEAPSPDTPVRTLEVEIPDGRVHIRVLGSGAPVLFLHGVSAHGRTWLAVAERLVSDAAPAPGGGRAAPAGGPIECWLPDLLGRGRSEARDDISYRLADEVRRARDLVGAIGAARGHPGFPALLVGHSQGAAIALALAREEPAVRGLVLANPVTADIRRPRVLQLLRAATLRGAAAALFSPLSEPLGRAILRRAGGPAFRPSREAIAAYAGPYRDRRRARALMRIMADWRPADLRDKLPERPLVARVLAGLHDPRIPERAAARLAGALGVPLIRVTDGGHVLPEQHPERLAGEIRAALAELAMSR